MIYDLSIVALKPNRIGSVLPRLREEIGKAVRFGTFLGCFSCDFGVLNRFAVLASYDDLAAVHADRRRQDENGNPYGVVEHLVDLKRDAFTPLSFVPEIKPGAYGPFYEVRTYGVGFGGIPRLAEAWSKVIERRQQLSQLLMVMESIEGASKALVHIWPYKTLDARATARAQASKDGIWPPPGSSDDLVSLQSELFVATAFSPLS